MSPILASRAYSGPQEIPAIAHVFAICEAHDQSGEHIQEQDLHDDYGAPEYNAPRFVHLWHAQNDTLVACADLWPPRGKPGESAIPELFVYFAIHPELRGQGIEEEILAWAESERTLLSQERGEQLVLSSSVSSTQPESARFLETHGFKPVRTFYTMECDLRERQSGVEGQETPYSVPLPDGMTFKTAALTPEEYAALRNTIWVDHYAYQPLSTEQAAHERQSADYDPSLDLSLHTHDGSPIGFCTCMIHAEENEKLQRTIGWVHRIGVRREYRGTGLGRALLQAGMACIRDAGMDSVRLGVDASNATGALQLYTSEGFTPLYTRTRYMRE